MRPLLRLLNTMTFAVGALAACAAFGQAAHAQAALEKKSLGLPGWTLFEKGDFFADPATAEAGEVYEATAVYEDAAMKFSIGCTFGSYIDVVWQPSQPLTGVAVQTSFSIDGATVASHVFLARSPDGAPHEYGWAEQGGDALKLAEAIYEKWTGTLVISGGGVTDTISFDEEKMGGVSELVLMACGQ